MKKMFASLLFLMAAITDAASLELQPNGQAELTNGTDKLAVIYPHFGTRNPQMWFKPGVTGFQYKIEPEKDGIQVFPVSFLQINQAHWSSFPAAGTN